MKVSQARVLGSLLTIRDSLTTGVMLLDNSQWTMSNSQVLNSETYGILLERSSVLLERCEIVESDVAGVVVDGIDKAMVANGCCIDSNAVGVLLMSGTIELTGGEIHDNDTGILVARRHRLNHEPTCDAPMQVIADDVNIRAALRAVQFLSPASYRFSASTLRDPHGQSPFVAAGLTEEVVGDLTHVRQTPGYEASPGLP